MSQGRRHGPGNQTQQRCVLFQWPQLRSAYNQNQGGVYFAAWHGSLLTNKRDGSGLEDKRNRAYDPQTGRFTQEDPIGLAGGLNAFGFAGSDPVNYSDPFGLNPCLLYPQACIVAAFAATSGIGAAVGQVLSNLEAGRPASEGVATAGLAGVRNGLAMGLAAEFGGRALGSLFRGGSRAGAEGVSGGPQVTFGHGARHLQDTGLGVGQVETAIRAQVANQAGRASATGSFYGRVTVEGVTIEYRAYTLKSGVVNVGTYYLP